MQPPSSLPQRAGWVLVVASLAAPALAAEQPCTGVTVTAHPGVVGRWPALPERVRRAVAERSDIDHCARAHLGTSGESITLEVILDDGRSTIRKLSAAEDVVPALEALLLVPPREVTTTTRAVETVPPPRHAETKSRRRSPPARPPVMSERDAAAPAERGELVQPEAGVGFLFSVGGGARTGDGQTSGNLGAMALLHLSGWLVGLDGRAVTYEVPLSAGIPQSATELTAIAGYRFGEGMFALDLMLGPTLVVQQDMEVSVGPAVKREPTTISRVVPRLFFGSRLTLGARSVLGGFVGIEGAAGPSGEAGTGDTQAPALPEWMFGFVVGATLGIL